MAQPATTNANGATIEQLLACPGEYTRDAPLRLSTCGAEPAPTLSLFDFNILARPYCDGVRRFRTHPTPELLAWNWRRARIHEMVVTAQADVVCMQELVQAEFESAEQRAAQAAAQAAQAAKEAQAAQAAAQRKADMARKAAAKAARAQARQVNGASSNGSAAADDAGAAASAATPAAAESAPAADAAPVASPSPLPSAVAAAPADVSAPASAAPAAAAEAADGRAAAVTAENDDDLRDDDGDDEVSSTASVNYVPPVEGDFSTFLADQGYAYRLQTPAARADKYPVGTGIFWRLSRFYETPVVVDSRSRALIVALKLRPLRSDAPEPPASLDNVVFVCNVHLQGHHSETATRLNQVKSLFKQLEKHVASVARGVNGSGGAAAAAQKQKDKTKAKAATGAPPAAAAAASDDAASAIPAAAVPASPPATAPMLLLTGDFNQTHKHSAVHRLAVKGHVPAGFCDERLRNHPDLFAQRGIVTPVEVSQPFPLESVYDRERRAAPLFPRYTYHNNHYVGSPYNDVLDYIYHTAATLPLLASMRVVDEEEAVRIEETSLPNELIPSDHLPIGATFFVPSLAAARQGIQEGQDGAEQKR